MDVACGQSEQSVTESDVVESDAPAGAAPSGAVGSNGDLYHRAEYERLQNRVGELVAAARASGTAWRPTAGPGGGAVEAVTSASRVGRGHGGDADVAAAVCGHGRALPRGGDHAGSPRRGDADPQHPDHPDLAVGSCSRLWVSRCFSS